MTQMTLFSIRSEKQRSRPRGLLARVGAWVSQLAWGLAARFRPAQKPKKRHATRGMILDLLDVANRCIRDKHYDRRLVLKADYMARQGRGSEESRGRRWSTFRAFLRFAGVAHEQAGDDHGVILADPEAALSTAKGMLPPVEDPELGEDGMGVGLTALEERQHEAARRDAEVWIGLGVARIHGPMGVSGVEGLVRLAGVLR